MKKRHIKQLVAFVVLLLSAAAMDSQPYIQCGLVAIGSTFYLLVSARKEQNDVYAIRRGRVNRWKGYNERPYLEKYPLCNERRYKP